MKRFYQIIILGILIIVAASGCGRQVFNGSRTGNDKQFIMDYSVLNRTETHEMNLEQGSIVDVVIENNSGRVDILVTDADGQEIYRGDDASSSKFSLNIPKTGTYKFSVTGSKAKGSVSFKAAE